MNDFRFGLRILARNAASTVLIVCLLALGAGASTIVFSLFDAVLVRPLPVLHPEQLVRMVQRFPNPLGLRSEFPYAYYKALRDRSQTLRRVFAETEWHEHFRMTEPEPPEDITVYGVTPQFFVAIGSQPLMGRFLTAADATRDFGTPPAVLSYRFWHRRFAGNSRSIIGQRLAINGHRFLITGVMPRNFQGLSIDSGPDIRIPLASYSLLTPEFDQDQTDFTLAARLKPGVTLAQAQLECQTIWRPVMQDYYKNVEKLPPESVSRLLKRGMEVQSLERGTSILRDNFGDVFRLLMASASLLVMIVALNVAGLLLARAAVRQRELAVRFAIGASRLRIARQLFAESLLLWAFGACGGLLVALIMMPLALQSLPPVRDMSAALVPVSLDAGLNWRVFFFLLGSSLVTTIIFTLAPVAAASQLSIDGVLRTVRSSGSFRGRRILIVGQIALCTVLFAASGLLVRSFQRLHATPSGFAINSVVTFGCDGGTSKYPPGMVDALIERVREIPGVISAASSSTGVLRGHGVFMTAVPGGQAIRHSDFLDTNSNQVSLDYFATMGMHLVAGRDFVPSDEAQPKPVNTVKVIVNKAFVRRLFPGSNGIGKRFGTGVEGSIARGSYEIVGVVSDAKYRSLRDPIYPMTYSLETTPDFDFMLNVRTRTAPQAIVQPVRQALASVAPHLELLETETLAQAVDEITAPERISAALVSVFGVIAALLAGIGTYGLLACAVAQRRREIGIRMAVGAGPSQVGKLIAVQTFAIAATGIAIGLGATLLTGPIIRSRLYDVSPQEPTVLAAAAISVALIAIAASLGPVWDAVQTPPAEALRIET